MLSSPSGAPSLPHRALAGDDEEAVPWVLHGIVAGLLGASIVALFFLAVDVLAGRPLWTPSVLAAALFRGELPSSSARPEPLELFFMALAAAFASGLIDLLRAGRVTAANALAAAGMAAYIFQRAHPRPPDVA